MSDRYKKKLSKEEAQRVQKFTSALKKGNSPKTNNAIDTLIKAFVQDVLSCTLICTGVAALQILVPIGWELLAEGAVVIANFLRALNGQKPISLQDELDRCNCILK